MPITDENELALIHQARRGSAQALAMLLQMNYAIVYRYLVKLTMDPSSAEDAVQDAMERAVRNFMAFDPEKAKFSTWLVTIARNRWLDEIRKGRRLRPMEDSIADHLTHDPYGELIESDDLLSAIRRLDEKTRAPVTMYHLLGYRYEEIAQQMKIPLGTVKSRISNGIKQLRKELEDHGSRSGIVAKAE